MRGLRFSRREGERSMPATSKGHDENLGSDVWLVMTVDFMSSGVVSGSKLGWGAVGDGRDHVCGSVQSE